MIGTYDLIFIFIPSGEIKKNHRLVYVVRMRIIAHGQDSTERSDKHIFQPRRPLQTQSTS